MLLREVQDRKSAVAHMNVTGHVSLDEKFDVPRIVTVVGDLDLQCECRRKSWNGLPCKHICVAWNCLKVILSR